MQKRNSAARYRTRKRKSRRADSARPLVIQPAPAAARAGVGDPTILIHEPFPSGRRVRLLLDCVAERLPEAADLVRQLAERLLRVGRVYVEPPDESLPFSRKGTKRQVRVVRDGIELTLTWKNLPHRPRKDWVAERAIAPEMKDKTWSERAAALSYRSGENLRQLVKGRKREGRRKHSPA